MATLDFDRAILCINRRHGEYGAVVRVLTPDNGLLAGYVQGAKSRERRPLLQPGNVVSGQIRGRVATQLPAMTLELVHSRAPHYAEPLSAAGIEWACLAVGTLLPEGQSYPAIYNGFDALLNAITGAPSARGWAEALIRFELLLLSELGFGLDLETCAVTGGHENLTYVSPRTGRAVSDEGAVGYRKQLLTLPPFLISAISADRQGLRDGLALTGHFLERYFFADARKTPMQSRERLVERLEAAFA
ncbi:DNA repair protein RecO [Alterisphingorhabdus coralli]|uniref:DNA repair protein RecO n=1 Tax=Alterisphingorhabdus coralli TaxID=3071408 RepID=A0AA97F681_9SPHN|nr:DNA repair protein RecO [Parasphingorhabdus sp. SCSIO 66989]WOE73857.1 DNA repair protein RecO [Parasphingorhabdus sp. SCSIO 66989]